jgi:serine/threonine-protein kinase
VPAELERIINKAIQKNRDLRYQSAAELRTDLQHLNVAISASPATARETRRFGIRTAISLTAVLLLAGIGIGLFRPGSPRGAGDSIVVLPFENGGNDPDVSYLSEGLPDSITDALSRVRNVRVIARTTASMYKAPFDVRRIGRELHVRAVVTGKCSRARSQIRIQADLIDAAAGTELWGQQYEGSPDEVLRIQRDLVEQVSERLRVEMTTEDKGNLSRHSTNNPEAYRLYLQGRYALGRTDLPNIKMSIELFTKALEIDSLYALAHAGLADSYIAMSGAYVKPNDAMPKARAAANRALELDPGLPEAHVSLGIIDCWYEFSCKESTNEFKHALGLNPNDAMAHLWYGWALLFTGHAADAIIQAQAAHELDPLSPFVETGLGQMYYYAGDPQEAIQRIRRVVELDPTFFPGHYYLGVAYLFAKDYSNAIHELEAATHLDSEAALPVAYLVYIHAMLGRKEEAGDWFKRLNELRKTTNVGPVAVAVVQVALGHREEAMGFLQEAYRDRDDSLTILKFDPVFDSLHSDPRYQELESRLYR